MTAAEIARALGDHADQLVALLLAGGHLERNRDWRCGSVAGEAGASLVVRLAGNGRGRWRDFATGEGGDMLDLVAASQQLDLAGAIAWARRWLGLEDGGRAPAAPAATLRRREANEQRIAGALDLWRYKTAPAAGTVVETYWRSRGLGRLAIPSTIRISRFDLRHPEGGCRPCMVALAEHVEHGAVAVHRTFLAFDGSGKASFRSPRLSLGPVGGAAIRLAAAPEHEPLVVAEGIETAASAMLATGFPAWAALSAGGIERLVLPPVPAASTVIIAADHDRNGVGQRAARSAADRWLAEGRHVRIALPPAPGSDFNDLLNMREACHVAAA
jgi:hypothetical protein